MFSKEKDKAFKRQQFSHVFKVIKGLAEITNFILIIQRITLQIDLN